MGTRERVARRVGGACVGSAGMVGGAVLGQRWRCEDSWGEWEQGNKWRRTKPYQVGSVPGPRGDTCHAHEQDVADARSPRLEASVSLFLLGQQSRKSSGHINPTVPGRRALPTIRPVKTGKEEGRIYITQTHMEANSRKHVILVHGACHGAWCWFKVATRLRSAGHRVTTPDLAASGVDPRPLREVPTFRDYTKPLLDILDALPAGEKVVLVGHSLGGMSIALDSELFPEKVTAAVFLTAFMPDRTLPPSHVLEKAHTTCIFFVVTSTR